jgi:8-amino-7-oxononanoate synthase
VSGHLPPVRDLERDLARWEEAESALVFSSGFATNLAVVSSLAGKPDMIFSDAWNHASLIDGCRLSGARVHVYRHLDLDHLAGLLRSEGHSGRRRLIVSDSVFSMDGDVAPAGALLDLADRHGALLILDEAHATGVLGEQGRGVTDELTAAERLSDRLIKVGTLSKALGAQGGFVCGSRRLIRWLVNHARPYVFSTALAPPAAAAARAALRVVRTEPERRQGLLSLVDTLRRELSGMGVEAGPSRCPIVPVVVGAARRALALARRLEGQGLLVPAIRPPSVPEGTARLRISLTAGHTPADVERLVSALRVTRCCH